MWRCLELSRTRNSGKSHPRQSSADRVCQQLATHRAAQVSRPTFLHERRAAPNIIAKGIGFCSKLFAASDGRERNEVLRFVTVPTLTQHTGPPGQPQQRAQQRGRHGLPARQAGALGPSAWVTGSRGARHAFSRADSICSGVAPGSRSTAASAKTSASRWRGSAGSDSRFMDECTRTPPAASSSVRRPRLARSRSRAACRRRRASVLSSCFRTRPP